MISTLQLATINRQRPVYTMLLADGDDIGIQRRRMPTPAEARRAIVALSGISHAAIARAVEKKTKAPTSRQLVSMIIDGRGRSDRVEREIARIYGVPHQAFFPEPRSRRPSKQPSARKRSKPKRKAFRQRAAPIDVRGAFGTNTRFVDNS